MTRIGFVGLGDQGAPMARRIGDAGLPLAVWARRAEVSATFADRASVVGTPAEVGASSDIVGVCVPADGDVLEVVLGAEGIMGAMGRGGILAVHSTVHPRTMRRLADHGSPRGISVVDAPVSGGAGKAGTGQLTVLVGGDADDVSRCQPMFASYASTVIHLGGLGAGQTAKLMNNLAVTAHLAIATELFDFAQRMGVDRSALASVLSAGSGGSSAAEFLAASDFDLGEMWERSRRLLSKDVDIVLELARGEGAATPQAALDAARSYLRGPTHEPFDARPRTVAHHDRPSNSSVRSTS